MNQESLGKVVSWCSKHWSEHSLTETNELIALLESCRCENLQESTKLAIWVFEWTQNIPMKKNNYQLIEWTLLDYLISVLPHSYPITVPSYAIMAHFEFCFENHQKLLNSETAQILDVAVSFFEKASKKFGAKFFHQVERLDALLVSVLAFVRGEDEQLANKMRLLVTLTRHFLMTLKINPKKNFAAAHKLLQNFLMQMGENIFDEELFDVILDIVHQILDKDNFNFLMQQIVQCENSMSFCSQRLQKKEGSGYISLYQNLVQIFDVQKNDDLSLSLPWFAVSPLLLERFMDIYFTSKMNCDALSSKIGRDKTTSPEFAYIKFMTSVTSQKLMKEIKAVSSANAAAVSDTLMATIHVLSLWRCLWKDQVMRMIREQPENIKKWVLEFVRTVADIFRWCGSLMEETKTNQFLIFAVRTIASQFLYSALEFDVSIIESVLPDLVALFARDAQLVEKCETREFSFVNATTKREQIVWTKFLMPFNPTETKLEVEFPFDFISSKIIKVYVRLNDLSSLLSLLESRLLQTTSNEKRLLASFTCSRSIAAWETAADSLLEPQKGSIMHFLMNKILMALVSHSDKKLMKQNIGDVVKLISVFLMNIQLGEHSLHDILNSVFTCHQILETLYQKLQNKEFKDVSVCVRLSSALVIIVRSLQSWCKPFALLSRHGLDEVADPRTKGEQERDKEEEKILMKLNKIVETANHIACGLFEKSAEENSGDMHMMITYLYTNASKFYVENFDSNRELLETAAEHIANEFIQGDSIEDTQQTMQAINYDIKFTANLIASILPTKTKLIKKFVKKFFSFALLSLCSQKSFFDDSFSSSTSLAANNRVQEIVLLFIELPSLRPIFFDALLRDIQETSAALSAAFELLSTDEAIKISKKKKFYYNSEFLENLIKISCLLDLFYIIPVNLMRERLCNQFDFEVTNQILQNTISIRRQCLHLSLLSLLDLGANTDNTLFDDSSAFYDSLHVAYTSNFDGNKLFDGINQIIRKTMYQLYDVSHVTLRTQPSLLSRHSSLTELFALLCALSQQDSFLVDDLLRTLLYCWTGRQENSLQAKRSVLFCLSRLGNTSDFKDIALENVNWSDEKEGEARDERRGEESSKKKSRKREREGEEEEELLAKKAKVEGENRREEKVKRVRFSAGKKGEIVRARVFFRLVRFARDEFAISSVKLRNGANEILMDYCLFEEKLFKDCQSLLSCDCSQNSPLIPSVVEQVMSVARTLRDIPFSSNSAAEEERNILMMENLMFILFSRPLFALLPKETEIFQQETQTYEYLTSALDFLLQQETGRLSEKDILNKLSHSRIGIQRTFAVDYLMLPILRNVKPSRIFLLYNSFVSRLLSLCEQREQEHINANETGLMVARTLHLIGNILKCREQCLRLGSGILISAKKDALPMARNFVRTLIRSLSVSTKFLMTYVKKDSVKRNNLMDVILTTSSCNIYHHVLSLLKNHFVRTNANVANTRQAIHFVRNVYSETLVHLEFLSNHMLSLSSFSSLGGDFDVETAKLYFIRDADNLFHVMFSFLTNLPSNVRASLDLAIIRNVSLYVSILQNLFANVLASRNIEYVLEILMRLGRIILSVRIETHANSHPWFQSTLLVNLLCLREHLHTDTIPMSLSANDNANSANNSKNIDMIEQQWKKAYKLYYNTLNVLMGEMDSTTLQRAYCLLPTPALKIAFKDLLTVSPTRSSFI